MTAARDTEGRPTLPGFRRSWRPTRPYGPYSPGAGPVRRADPPR